MKTTKTNQLEVKNLRYNENNYFNKFNDWFSLVSIGRG